MAYFLGMRIIVTDNMEPAAGGTTGALNKYPVYCAAVAPCRRCAARAAIEADRNILSKQDVMSVSTTTVSRAGH